MIGVQTRATQSQIDWRYLGREALLILLFAWALPIAGGMDGLISFRGQAGSALIFTCVAGIWLLHRLWTRRRLPKTGLEIPLIFFVVIQVVSAAVSDVPRLSLPAIAQTLAYILLFYLALDLARSGWPTELVDKCLLIGGAIILALAALDLATALRGWLAFNDLPYPPPFEHRLYSVVGDANILAGFTNLVWPIALARLLTTRGKLARVLLAALIVLAGVVQFFCYSRGATLASAAGLAVFVVAWVAMDSERLRRQALKGWRWLVANPIWLVGLCLAGASLGAALGWRLLVSRNSATQAPALEARSEFWGVAWQSFVDHPWLGVGPGAFPQAMSVIASAPPTHLFMNAHSQFFNTLAETGALGVLAAAILLMAFGWQFWRAHRVADPHDRARWVATLAAWTAFLAHGLVDYHVRYLALAVPLLVTAASTLAAPQPPARRVPRTWSIAWLAPIAVVVAAFSAWQLSASFRLDQATLAARDGEWAVAAQRADQASALDPAFGYYAAQSGYAYAELAARLTGDAAGRSRDTAIERFVAALAAGPDLAQWEVNLAVLLHDDGDNAAALQHLERAQQIAPAWGTPAALRGLWLESDEVAARTALADALEREPALADSAIWTVNDLRRGVLAQWRANASTPADSLSSQIGELIAKKRLPDAQLLIEKAWLANPSSPWVYRTLSLHAAAQGSPTLAARYLDAADWLQSVVVRDQVSTAWVRADQAAAAGDFETAAASYGFMWDAVAQVSAYGWGYLGYVPEAHFIFQRDSWAAQLVPQMPQIDFDAAIADALKAWVDSHPALAPAAPDVIEQHIAGASSP